jgi:hypothetical protein
MRSHPIPKDRRSAAGRAVLDGRTVHIPDVLADPEYELTGRARIGAFRTLLGVPLMREGTPIGVIVLQRQTVRPFTDKQIELVTMFADQAVIAIENARLFDEVQARTHELARSVEELRALGEVSQAVNSTLDLETVLTVGAPNDGTNSLTRGRSGSACERASVDTARARSLPALMYSIDAGMVSKPSCTCPARRSVKAGAFPRYCTWTTSIPVIALNNSPARWLEVPAPGDSTLILPGLALA